MLLYRSFQFPSLHISILSSTFPSILTMLSLSAHLSLTPSLRPDNPTHNSKCNSNPTHLRISTKEPILARQQNEFDLAGKKYSGAGASPEDEIRSIPDGLRRELMPEHVAVIMDGNRRWARMRGLPSGSGYEAGIRAFRVLVELCCKWGIRVLTVFAFSSDNWVRPKMEVDFLMNLFEKGIKAELDNFMREDIKVSIIGDPSKLPMSLQRLIALVEENTKHNSGLHLVVAVNYSGKYDIVQACQSIAQKAKDGLIEPEDINDLSIEQELETNCADYPYPDLLIRTSGELRVSNFFLWQLAYTELFFSKSHWPDFGEADLLEALFSFQQRQRRYGGYK